MVSFFTFEKSNNQAPINISSCGHKPKIQFLFCYCSLDCFKCLIIGLLMCKSLLCNDLVHFW